MNLDQILKWFCKNKAAFSYHILAAERGLNYRNFDSHMRSKLLQCGENTHTLSQVYNTRLYRVATRLDSARDRKQVWRHHVRI